MQKLTTLQNLIKINKNEYNSFGKYKYRTAEAIMHEAKPFLKELDLTLHCREMIMNINDNIVIKSIAILEDNESKEKIHGVAFAGVDLGTKGMHVAQCYGASTSYARKYALQGLLMLDDSSDDIDSKDNTKINNVERNSIANAILKKPTFSKDNFKKAYENKATFEDIRKHYILTENVRQEYLIYINEQVKAAELP